MNWLECFSAAAQYSGYAVALSTSGPTSSVELAAALGRARSSLTVLGQDGAWLAIERHLGSLAPAGIKVVAFQNVSLLSGSHEFGFHVLAARNPGSIDLSVEQAFVAGFGNWLTALGQLLPTFKLSQDAQDAATSIATTAGLTDPLLVAGLKIVLQFAQGSGQIKALVVLPATKVSESFIEKWRATDLVDARTFHPWVVEWLWNIDTNDVYASGSGSNRTFFGAPNNLRDVLRTICR